MLYGLQKRFKQGSEFEGTMYEEAAPINVIVHPFFCFYNAPSETPTFIYYAYKVV